MKILLAEDDQMLGKAIKNALEAENNVVDLVTDGEMCEIALKTSQFEILLLDINLPVKSGLEVLKTMRAKKNHTPVLILTARGSVLQKIEGLDLGADDYMVKPFDLDEFMARIRSLIRRSKGISSAIIQHKNITLDPASHKVDLDGKTVIDLSPKEFIILKILLESAGKVKSRQYLEEMLYSWDDSVESNAVEVYIHHLRKKLGNSAIKTIRGVGYVIE